MPTYLYKDTESGEIYEIRQSMRDDALTHHPETGAPIKRVPARPAIAFKGSGFYANDSRKGPSGEGAAKSESAASTPASPPPSPAKGGE